MVPAAEQGRVRRFAVNAAEFYGCPEGTTPTGVAQRLYELLSGIDTAEVPLEGQLRWSIAQAVQIAKGWAEYRLATERLGATPMSIAITDGYIAALGVAYCTVGTELARVRAAAKKPAPAPVPSRHW